MPRPLLCCAVLLAFLFASPVAADNAIVGTGHGVSCTEASLDAGLQQVVVGVQAPGGTLTFDCGAAPVTIPITTQKFISGQVVIDGGGRVTLDAQNLVRHFQLALDDPEGRTEVAMRDITLIRGFAAADFGGAILARSGVLLALQGVTIRDSRAGLTGGAVGIEPGATTLTIDGSTFTQNRALDGGAIATSATTIVRTSRFFGNSADTNQGGAIQSWVEDLSVEDSDFGFNSAARGGAIYKRDARLGIRDSRFYDNLGRVDGGAIYTEEGVTTFSVALSNFDRNSAIDQGGAIVAGRELQLTSVGFDGNRARTGGAIRMLNSVFTSIAYSTFANNEAELAGGAIAATTLTPPPGDPALLFTDQSTFAYNRVTAGIGGDLHVSAGSGLVAVMSKSTLMGASASSGGFSLHAASGNVLVLLGNLLWTPGANGCVVEGTSTITSGGYNLGPSASCGLTESSDGTLLSFADFGLGEFADYGGPLPTFLPDADSIALDWRACDSQDFVDMRFSIRPIDGDGDGEADCDAGSVERQRSEAPGALFRDGFEGLSLPGEE
jgi:predicted outer membrane repeat protein